MPELPDISAYISALEPRIVGQPLEPIRFNNPFLLRTAQPPVSSVGGQVVRGVRRIGKRIVIGLENDLWLALHLMIAGRLHWQSRGAKLVGREEALRSIDPGGIEIFSSDLNTFRGALSAENHTLKRALTDPRLVSGIGNAYSDEILHAAQLSPIALTQKLDESQWERLFAATRHTIEYWTERLVAEAKNNFPEKVTAFRKGMAVHGRYGEPCPRCGEKVLRIRYADKETNYCARCQTSGKVLADRSLSRLLGSDWPRTLEELEALKRR
jgi:formamidopyrimidine-DNA glycosylase